MNRIFDSNGKYQRTGVYSVETKGSIRFSFFVINDNLVFTISTRSYDYTNKDIFEDQNYNFNLKDLASDNFEQLVTDILEFAVVIDTQCEKLNNPFTVKDSELTRPILLKALNHLLTMNEDPNFLNTNLRGAVGGDVIVECLPEVEFRVELYPDSLHRLIDGCTRPDFEDVCNLFAHTDNQIVSKILHTCAVKKASPVEIIAIIYKIANTYRGGTGFKTVITHNPEMAQVIYRLAIANSYTEFKYLRAPVEDYGYNRIEVYKGIKDA